MAELSRLPITNADVWLWQQSGSCRDSDPLAFFHPEGERGPAKDRREAAAIAVCATCPVIQACRRHALAVREPFGVWGGLTENELQRLYSEDQADLLCLTNSAVASDKSSNGPLRSR